MYRCKSRYLVFLIMLSMSLTGCSSLSVENTKNKVDEYNKLVQGTVDSYSSSVAYSKKIKDNLIEDLTKDKGVALNERYKLDRLTDEEKKAFEHPMINMDEYFTSLGASSTREVILIVGSNKMVMNIILVWSENDLLGIERRVVKND